MKSKTLFLGAVLAASTASPLMAAMTLYSATFENATLSGNTFNGTTAGWSLGTYNQAGANPNTNAPTVAASLGNDNTRYAINTTTLPGGAGNQGFTGTQANSFSFTSLQGLNTTTDGLVLSLDLNTIATDRTNLTGAFYTVEIRQNGAGVLRSKPISSALNTWETFTIPLATATVLNSFSGTFSPTGTTQIFIQIDGGDWRQSVSGVRQPVSVTSGFDNVIVTAIPEVSTALLGALGSLALLRRRR